MPLLKTTCAKSKKVSLHVLVEENLLSEIKAYCDWANMRKPTEFVIQAAHYVLQNDKEWRKANKHPDFQDG